MRLAAMLLLGRAASLRSTSVVAQGGRRSLKMMSSSGGGDIEAGGDSRRFLAQKVAMAVREAFGEDLPERGLVSFASRFEFGDYQCNVAMGLANKVKKNPREVAETLRSALDDDAAFGSLADIDIAGPGFLNLRLKDTFLADTTRAMAKDKERAATPKSGLCQKIVVDYSSPNIAKEMHVGHLRSTVIGDALANVLEHNGHEVIRQNHVGDWGTQFGMLIAHLEDQENTTDDISDLVVFYKEAKARFDSDLDFKERARKKVVGLQSGDDEACLRRWRAICEASRREFKDIYTRLGVSPNLQERGESTYNDALSGVIEHLTEKGLAEESQGALVVYLNDDDDESKKKKKKKKKETEEEEEKVVERPAMIVRKTDGGFNYATTDLAAAKYRGQTLEADRVLYVTDSGQAGHFKQVFQVARRAGFVDDSVSLEHVPFGLVQGVDGKKFKTRAGDTVKLKDLLDEATARAKAGIEERRSPDDDDAVEDSALAEVIGIAAIKYADLSLNRESNYRFSFDKMLALNGNTAPYMLYSMARIAGIQRKIAEDLKVEFGDVSFSEPEERNLARVLARLAPILNDLEKDLKPNVLCDYLFDLAQTFNRFYEVCPVRNAPTPDVAASRATLCAATASALQVGLTILGIPIVERM